MVEALEQFNILIVFLTIFDYFHWLLYLCTVMCMHTEIYNFPMKCTCIIYNLQEIKTNYEQVKSDCLE